MVKSVGDVRGSCDTDEEEAATSAEAPVAELDAAGDGDLGGGSGGGVVTTGGAEGDGDVGTNVGPLPLAGWKGAQL